MVKYATVGTENSHQGTYVKKSIIESHPDKKDIFVFKLN
jgi:hypothetical protein